MNLIQDELSLGSAVHALFEGYVNQSKYMPFILTRCFRPIGPGQLGDRPLQHG
jgi:hypothetical protein